MSNQPLTVPPPDEIARRIVACRDELKALKQLFRLSKAVEDARQAQERRGAASQQEVATCAS